MKSIIVMIICCLASVMTACSQANSGRSENDRRVGGNCEGCEAVYEAPGGFENLSWSDTLPGFNEPGPRMMIEGTVYKADGKTPAPGVVIYMYHTDQAGIYSRKGNETGLGRTHGYIRTWIRTNEKGQYRFYTLKPASYPNTRAEKHIHTIIKEKGVKPYSIESFVFADDPFLSDHEKNKRTPKGGSGIITLIEKDGILTGKRDITLGLNIDGY